MKRAQLVAALAFLLSFGQGCGAIAYGKVSALESEVARLSVRVARLEGRAGAGVER